MCKICGPQNVIYSDISCDSFKNIMGVTYTKHLSFSSTAAEKGVLRQCSKALREGIIDEEMVWLGKLFERHITAGFIGDVIIKWINHHLGFGLYAEKDISAWEYIGEYTGKIKRKRWLFSNINEYCFEYSTSHVYHPKYTIDAKWYGNETRYINHSDYPNCEAVSVYCEDGLFHIVCRAIKDIPKGAQITTDYGYKYWVDKKNKLPN